MKKITKNIKQDVYIASDGKEFNSKMHCLDYEREIEQSNNENFCEKQLSIKTKVDFPSMININHDYEYKLFQIKNENDLDLFIKTYKYWFRDLENYREVDKEQFNYPDILCILDFPKGPDEPRLYNISQLCRQFNAFIEDIQEESTNF